MYDQQGPPAGRTQEVTVFIVIGNHPMRLADTEHPAQVQGVADAPDRCGRTATTQSAVTEPLVTAARITTFSPGWNWLDAAAVPFGPNRVRGVMVIFVCAPARVRTVQVGPDWFTMTARTMVRAPADAAAPVGVATGAGRVDTVPAGAALSAVNVESPDPAAVTANQPAATTTAMATTIAAMEVACPRSHDLRDVGWLSGGTYGIGSVGWVTGPPSGMHMHVVPSICQGLVMEPCREHRQAD